MPGSAILRQIVLEKQVDLMQAHGTDSTDLSRAKPRGLAGLLRLEGASETIYRSVFWVLARNLSLAGRSLGCLMARPDCVLCSTRPGPECDKQEVLQQGKCEAPPKGKAPPNLSQAAPSVKLLSGATLKPRTPEANCGDRAPNLTAGGQLCDSEAV